MNIILQLQARSGRDDQIRLDYAASTLETVEDLNACHEGKVLDLGFVALVDTSATLFWNYEQETNI